MQIPIAQKFRNAISDFLRSAPDVGKKPTSQARARVFIDEVEPQLARAFLLDQTERFMRAEERAAVKATPAKSDPQLRFAAPGFTELFRDRHQRLSIATGRKAKRLAIEDMTVTELRAAALVLKRRATQRAERAAEVDKKRAEYLLSLVEEMAPYAQVHRKLKFGDYLELREAGIKPDAAAKAAR